jgi:DNA-binding MarR family transcriptional regulator
MGPVAEMRWLSEDEQQSWRAYMEAARLLTDALDRQLQRDAGLSASDYEIFVRLSEADDHRMRMSDLAAATLFSRSRLSHAVARLESLGWVVRTTCPSDRRGTFAELTPAGMAKLADAAPGHVDAVRHHLVDPLTAAEFAQLGALSARLRQNLVASAPTGGDDCP